MKISRIIKTVLMADFISGLLIAIKQIFETMTIIAENTAMVEKK